MLKVIIPNMFSTTISLKYWKDVELDPTPWQWPHTEKWHSAESQDSNQQDKNGSKNSFNNSQELFYILQS